VTAGLIDLQINGVGDIAFSRQPSIDEYRRAGETLAAAGVRGYLATIPSAPSARYPAILDAAAEALRASGPGLLGVHLEGPFLALARRGAHAVRYLQPADPGWLCGLLDGWPGLVRLVTLAPELPGAVEVIAACRERGVLVAAGHSDATPEEAEHARPDMVTHLFNGMAPFHHRNPGLAGWALGHDTVVCGLIADGVHVHPAALRVAFAACGPDRVALVSDAVAADPTGTARLAEGAWRLPDGTLAGTAVLLDSALAVCEEAGIRASAARAAASATPARVLGLDA
jgi:N-acetylglucosamine-6-phosphate deacetylase